MSNKKKIAILGGGLGGLAAAYELTNHPGWQDEYEITLYQRGWRLGGKGASGRAGDAQRIEEHGLHCFWGFYDNAFHMLRTCYEEVNRTSGPIRKIDDAFKPLPAVWFVERNPRGGYFRYQMHFPTSSEKPWDTRERRTEMTPLSLLKSFLRDIVNSFAIEGALLAHFILQNGLTLVRELKEAIEALVDDEPDTLHQCGQSLMDIARPTPAVPTTDDDDDYRKYILIQSVRLGLVMMGGLLWDGIPRTLAEFDTKFDREDLRAWLARHGAGRDLLNSAIVRGLYNASFCYIDGDLEKANLATGVSLRTVLLMGFTYRGAFMWKMEAGMGDIVFAPLYEALRARGVKFEFFHTVKKLGLGADNLVDTIEIERQVDLTVAEYDPLIDVKGLPCWPAHPRWEQIKDADAVKPFDLESDWCSLPPVEKRTLRRGEGFDYVVLGIPVGALRTICADLVSADPKWRNMVDHVKTIRTKSFQVWLEKTPAQTAWMNKYRIMTDVYEDDFNSVADMYQTLPYEAWPATTAPGGIMYLCCAMKDDPNEPTSSDDGYQKSQDEIVKAESLKWLDDHKVGVMGWLPEGTSKDAFKELYFRANVNADQRYVLSVAGSAEHRIAPGDTGFENLFIAGDWTRSTLNLGCAEGATMSGLDAGRSARRVVVGAALKRASDVMSAEAAPFVEYPGMPVYAPPYEQRDLTICQFVLRADNAKLQSLVDRLMGGNAGVHGFRVLGRWVICQTGFIAENIGGPPTTEFGNGAETSLAFLVPVVRWRGLGSVTASPIEAGFFTPYVFVDQYLSLIAGREVLGMPKHLASFDPPGGPDMLDELTMSTDTLSSLSTSSKVEMKPLVRVVRRSGAAPRAFESIEELLEAAIEGAIGELNDAGLLREVLRRQLSPLDARFFSLRQLRDGSDPTRAAFREITVGQMAFEGISLQPLATPHSVEIEAHPSHPIATDLGFSSNVIEPVAEVKIHVDRASLARAR